MEQLHICVNGHSFKVVDEGEEPDPKTTTEVYFGVKCPRCGSLYEIKWPSDRGFKVVAE